MSTDDASTLASDNLGFAVDLYQALRSTGGNLVFSPASISIALAMTYAGAATTTASEIASTLHFTLPPARLHPAFDALDLALTTPPAGSAPNAFALKIANATWGQRGFPFLSSYLDLLAQDYGAGLRTVDFESAPEPSRAAINAWVSEQTEQRIPQILPPGSIDPATRLVLTDAVYFHGDWLTPFDPMSPMDTFHASSGDVSVAMMSNEATVPVWSGTGWTAASVPYVGGTTSMVLLVPDSGTFAQFESTLSADTLASIMAAETGGWHGRDAALQVLDDDSPERNPSDDGYAGRLQRNGRFLGDRRGTRPFDCGRVPSSRYRGRREGNHCSSRDRSRNS